MKLRSLFSMLAAVMLLSVSAFTSVAFGQASRLGATFTVNRLSNGSTTMARYTDVAWDPANQVYLVVWGAFGTVKGRFVTPDGALLGTDPFTIPTAACLYADAPRVAYSPDSGEFMIVWRDNRTDPNIPQAWARQLKYTDASGVPQFIAADFAVTNGWVVTLETPAIAYSTGSHEFFVLYNRDWALRARRFSNSGDLIGTEIMIAAPPAGGGDQMPGVAYNPLADEYLVVWMYFYDPSNGTAVQSRRVKAGTGDLLGSVTTVEPLTTDEIAVPNTAFDPILNDYLVTWYRDVYIGGAHQYTTFGRMVTADGTPAADRFTVASDGTYSEEGLARNPQSRNFFSVFTTHYGNPNLFGVQVSSAGAPDARIQVTDAGVSGAQSGVDYARVAAASDRPQWLVTGNIFWNKIIGQYVVSGNSSGSLSKLPPALNSSGTGTLSWSAIAGATYEVCIDTTNNNVCDTTWQSVSTAVSYAISLAPGTYYWQVRATVNGTTTEADGGTWANFTIATAAPGSFAKSTPANGATGQAAMVMTWGTASDATSYEYCVSTTNGSCSTWVTGSSGATVSNLTAGTTYYWQVRARNNAGTTGADGGTWWSFATSSQGGTTKMTPATGSAGLQSTVTLQWNAVANAGYMVCWDTTNNNSCDNAWWPAGALTSRTIGGLSDGTYYWQVRVYTASGTVEADGGAWWSFTVGQGATTPGAFGKGAPASGATGQAASVALTWGVASNATTYEYCVSTTNGTCSSTWVNGSSGTTVGGLTPGTTYYWQVRARDSAGTTDADGGTWWSFVTAGQTGTAKVSPSTGTAGLGSTVTLQWNPVANAGYTVCWDATNNNTCDNAWWPQGGLSSRTIEGLAAGTYYWQVRIFTASGTVEADSGTWWSFTVGAAQTPSAFGKSAPASGASGQATSVALTWGAASNATSYEYCVSTTSGSCSTWVTGTSGSTVSGLTAGTTYYWQVRARNGAGTTDADGGTWWSFATASSQGATLKVSPSTGTAGLGSTVTLQWNAVANAGYMVCWDTTNNNTCDNAWWPQGGLTSRTIEGLAAGTYYWQVRIFTASGTVEADNGTWWSFTVGAAPTTPGAFGKSTPASGATGQATSVVLTWGGASSATSYEYCVSTTSGSCSTWVTGTSGSTVSGLTSGTIYYWQVRARDSAGTTDADSGTWWAFTVGSAPVTNGKLIPVDGTAAGSAVQLTWSVVPNVSYYQVCITTTPNGSCDTVWRPAAISTTLGLSALAPGTYYWQVRALVNGVTTEMDSGVWWSFTVGATSASTSLAGTGGLAVTPVQGIDGNQPAEEDR